MFVTLNFHFIKRCKAEYNNFPLSINTQITHFGGKFNLKINDNITEVKLKCAVFFELEFHVLILTPEIKLPK